MGRPRHRLLRGARRPRRPRRRRSSSPPSPIAMAVVGNAATHLDILVIDGGIEDADDHTEPVRAAIQAVLERDWPSYIARRVGAA